MRLPSFRRLFSSDYPSQFKHLVDLLSVSLNNGIEVLYEALNGQLTIRDNIKSTVKDITVMVDSNGTPILNGFFSLNTTDKIDAIIVGFATNSTNSDTYPTSGIFISGQQSGTRFNINNITGLQANQTYVLRIVVFQQ